MSKENKSADQIGMIEQTVQERLAKGKGMKIQIDGISQPDCPELNIQFHTGQTLAPNYNESIQIDDFLFAIQTLGEFLDQQPTTTEDPSQQAQTE